MSRAEPVQQQLSPQVPGNKPAMAQPGGVAQQIGEERVAPDFTSHPDADFPGVGELPVPHVSPLTAHFHLAILRRFCALYDAVESTAANQDAKAQAVNRFLVCAEARYVQYLALLDTFIRQVAGSKETIQDLNAVIPLPPWDVAIIFHSHCLSPFRFYTDMLHRARRNFSNLWSKGLAFPLERLHLLISNGVWSDEQSQSIWDSVYKSPYQLWEADPASGTQLQLQDVAFACPWCSDPEMRVCDLASFTQTHITKSAISVCPACAHKFDADTLSAQYLKEDLAEFGLAEDAWCVKGAISGADDSSAEVARMDMKFILETVLHLRRHRSTKTSLATYIAAEDPTWQGIVNSFRKTQQELKSAQLLRMLSRRSIFNAIRVGYMGILWRDLSIDLVAAALRQREFAKKITGEECHGLDTPFALFKANTRYHKFLLLMNRKTASKRRYPNLVPTLDIDLCWHTHQLSPVPYRAWCMEHLGTAINHDDTIGRGDLDVGLRETSLAWYNAYRESYTTDDLRQSYMTTNRKIAGALFPPYGLYMLNKGKRLNQARLVVGNGPQTTGNAGTGFANDRSGFNNSTSAYPFMYAYPYWMMYPVGWGYYPAACASGLGGIGGWGAGVGATCGGGNCGAGGCASGAGACGSGGCGAGGCGGGGGGGCGGGS